MSKEQQQDAKEFSIKLVATVFFLLMALLLFAGLAKFIVLDDKDYFDSKVFEYFEEHTSPALVQLMEVVSFFGSNAFLFPAYVIICGWLFIKKKSRWAIDIGILALSSTGVMHALKALFRRPRPDLPFLDPLKTYSFPSGHALSSFVFAVAIIYLLWNEDRVPVWARWTFTLLLLLFALAIGFSRIILRAHYASDVLGGFALGCFWSIFALWMQDKIHRNAEKRKTKTVSA